MLQDERTGEASGKGFYIYNDKRQASIDPEIAKYVEKSRRLSGFVADYMIAGLTDKDIVEMLFFPVVNEACRILDEGISVKFPNLDIASIMGMEPKDRFWDCFATFLPFVPTTNHADNHSEFW
ncbi:peroxisomal fatty acid beta-oxidation multifunctional protein MFP2-like [Carex rostrata]